MNTGSIVRINKQEKMCPQEKRHRCLSNYCRAWVWSWSSSGPIHTQTCCLLESWHIQHHQAPPQQKVRIHARTLYSLAFFVSPFPLIYLTHFRLFINSHFTSCIHLYLMWLPLFIHPTLVSVIITDEGSCSAAETFNFNPFVDPASVFSKRW